MISWLALKSWKLDLEKRYLRWKLFLWELRWAWAEFGGMSEQKKKALYEQFKWQFTKHAEAGDADIQYVLGMIYGDRYDSLYTPLTKDEVSEVSAVLDMIYGDRCDSLSPSTKDEVTAAKWLTKAAKQGHANAQYELGLMYSYGSMYSYGDRVEYDSVMAAKWFHIAAEQGNAGAQCKLGKLYEGVLFEFGNDAYVSPDYVTAIHWYTKAAQQGHVGTAFQVGTAFLHSRRIRRRLGAGVGTAFQVGTAFLLKRCTKKWDYLRGLTKAAEQGHVIAQYKLGLMYYQGGEQGWDVSQSYVTAVHWMTKATQRGYAEAQISLARMYGRGEGVVQDTGKAVKWLTKAAKQGHAEAQYELGDFHLNPFGHGEVDDVKAAKWLTKAAEQGHAEAQYELGKIYRGDVCRYRGDVCRVKVDYVRAVKWFTKAAEQEVDGAPERLRDTVEKLNTLTAEIIYNSTRRELHAPRVNNIASVEALFGDLQK